MPEPLPVVPQQATQGDTPPDRTTSTPGPPAPSSTPPARSSAKPATCSPRNPNSTAPRFVGWWEALPHTACHNDAWSDNLFGVPETPGTSAPVTAIDWSMAGHAPYGSDMGNLALDLLRPAAALPGLDAAAFDGYVTGLRESGIRIERRLVRLGMVLNAAKWADSSRTWSPEPPSCTISPHGPTRPALSPTPAS